MIEKVIAYHCGPALAGIKPANLVSCYKDKIPCVKTALEQLNRQLNGKDIYFEILCECENRVLVMVYRRQTLWRCLQRAEIRTLLESFGYTPNAGLCACLSRLKSRLNNAEFPHEIGAFLGYPAHDIYGFIHHRSEGCLLTGEWKVYKNKEQAKKLFARYNRCRKALVRHLSQGKTLAQVFCAA